MSNDELDCCDKENDCNQMAPQHHGWRVTSALRCRYSHLLFYNFIVEGTCDWIFLKQIDALLWEINGRNIFPIWSFDWCSVSPTYSDHIPDRNNSIGVILPHRIGNIHHQSLADSRLGMFLVPCLSNRDTSCSSRCRQEVKTTPWLRYCQCMHRVGLTVSFYTCTSTSLDLLRLEPAIEYTILKRRWGMQHCPFSSF